MTDWIPKLKQYPHFDAPLSRKELVRLVTNPVRVASNSFFPFLRFEQKWQPFRSKNPRPAKKRRVIRYASRRDAAIFSYYRALLSERYESKLTQAGLDAAVLAYRKISTSSGGGKSNIHFAQDAFEAIRTFESCVVVALDISQFFESLDHAHLLTVWTDLLQVEELPADHAHVFRNITAYADVDRDEAYVRLDHAEWQKIGRERRLRLKRKRGDVPVQLCSTADFRSKIAGRGGNHAKLIERHKDAFGVPQGAPLSDLLANAYLFEFDNDLLTFATSRGGVYIRYSDDILLILPTTQADIATEVFEYASAQIQKYGAELQIKESKTSAYLYWRDGPRHRFQHLIGKGKEGLEYLGLRFDGARAFIRNSTVSRLHRNIVRATRSAAHRHVARYPGKTVAELLDLFNFAAFMQKYGRVKEFDPSGNPTTWTFWTYAVRAQKALGAFGSPIAGQLSRYRSFVRRRIHSELVRALTPRP